MRRFVLLLLVATATAANATGIKSDGWTPTSPRHFPPAATALYAGDFELLKDGVSWTECDATKTVNIALQSEVFSNASWTKAVGTAITADQVADPYGNVTADLITRTSDNTGSAFQGRVFAAAQTNGTASMWVRAVSGTSVETVGGACAGSLTSVNSCTRSDGGACTVGSSGTSAFAYGTFTTEWVRMSVQYTCSSSATWYIFAAPGQSFTDATGTGYFWGAQLEKGTVMTAYAPTTTAAASAIYGSRAEAATFTRASSATCQTTAGVLSTLSENQPRLEQYGLEMEGPSTNLALQSSTNNGLWTTTAGVLTITFGVAGAPDGTANVTRVADGDSGQANRRWGQVNITTTADISYVRSIYVKYVDIPYVAFRDNAINCHFNIQTGTVGTCNGSGWTNPMIVDAGNSWWRISAARVQATSGTLSNINILLAASDGTETSAGTGTSVLFWGGQIEAGVIPTSYIPTAGTSVTRVAERTTLAVAGRAGDATGVFRARLRIRGVTAGSFQRALSFGGSSPFYVNLSATSSTSYDGTNILNTVGHTSFLSREITPRVTWASTTKSLVEGSTSSSGTFDTTMLNGASMDIGSDSGTGSHFAGWIRDICTGDLTTECP